MCGIAEEFRIRRTSEVVAIRRQLAALIVEHQEIKPASDLGGVFDGFGTVECGDGFGKNRVEKICAAEAADPNAFCAVQIGAHQIGAAEFGAEQDSCRGDRPE